VAKEARKTKVEERSRDQIMPLLYMAYNFNKHMRLNLIYYLQLHFLVMVGVNVCFIVLEAGRWAD